MMRDFSHSQHTLILTVHDAQASMAAMKLNADSRDEQYTIRAYTDASVTVKDETYSRSLIITADKLIPDWSAPGFAELEISHFRELKEMNIEILLLGSGSQQRFPAQHLLVELHQLGIGIETMTTAAACRTYNILLAEGRSVAAALFIEP